MRKRGKQINLQRLGNVLAGILKKHNIFFDSEEQRLLEIWQKAVGPQISVQTRPDKLKRNTLSAARGRCHARFRDAGRAGARGERPKYSLADARASICFIILTGLLRPEG